MSDSEDSEAGASQIPDSEIFRRKIMMNVDGQDMLIDSLFSNFIQWCDAKDQTDEQVLEGYDKLLIQLDFLKLSCEKSNLAQKADLRQIEEYDKIYADMEKQIIEVKSIIAQKHIELEEAKKSRANKMKYDALGRIISALPDRKESMRQLQQVEEDIKSLKLEKEALEKKTEERQKDLHLLVTAARELKNKLRREEGNWEDSD